MNIGGNLTPTARTPECKRKKNHQEQQPDAPTNRMKFIALI